MKALILNYVSQIDRLFTLEEMLQATGLTRADAIEHWHALLDTGQVYEVRRANAAFQVPRRPFHPADRLRAGAGCGGDCGETSGDIG